MTKINVQCYKCKTVYELEPEMKGVLVECAVCGTVFTVPELSENFQAGILKTNPYAAEDKSSHAGGNEETNLHTARDITASAPDTSTTKLTTETIKLTKTSRGMIPRVDDKFGVCQAHNLKHHSKEKELLNTVDKMSAKEAKEVPPPKPRFRWWPWGGRKKK
ncbi:MAG: hypothetical protein PHV82_10670 [Victivallaceae bacterium]|nr:hypothetical protein [Victivallaceae bacterium]